MSKSSKRRRQIHERDLFVKKARNSKYRSRAVFKLKEIDDRFKLFKPGQVVIELGAAPGSWTQYVSARLAGKGRLIAVDLLSIEDIPDVVFIRGDFTDNSTVDKCLEELQNSKADLVISDMAPNLTGIRGSDQANVIHLAESVLDFARQALKPGGDMIVKLFHGDGSDQYRKQLIQHFQKVKSCKPSASRDNSREFYVLAQSYTV